MDTVPDRTPLNPGPDLDDVQLLLDARLVSRAKALDGDLSRTVSRALEAHLRRHQDRMTDEEIREALDAVNERHEKHGVMSDEFGAWN